MVRLNPPVTQRGKTPVSLDAPDTKVQRLLDRGWTLAEGETFDPSTLVKKPRELNAPDLGLRTTPDDTALEPSEKVSLDDIPDGDEDESDDESGDESDDDESDSGTGGGASAPAAPAASLPGLSGKSRDALVAIARAEGAAFEADATKPEVKRAIEAHRASK